MLLIVNTASQCGFTPQYEGLEALHRDPHDRGLVVLGFPGNQFGAQEPGEAAEIANFCTFKDDVIFPVLTRIDVNGAHAGPFYEWLKGEAPGVLGSKAIKRNFAKFLVDCSGAVVARYAPTTSPAALRGNVKVLF